MTIDEAIKKLENRRRKMWGKSFEPDREAMQLGIEALKAWKQFREGRWLSGVYKLPGETEE